MNQTEDIKELVIALCKVQGAMKPAIFNKKNPHYKSSYADFTSVMDACREHLSCNGLAVMQFCETVNDKLMLVTMIAHISGQWIKSYLPLVPKGMDSQSIGSAITYAKRYSLSAMLGIVSDDDEDDDAETSVGRGQHIQHGVQKSLSPSPAQDPKISTHEVRVLEDFLSKCLPTTQEALWALLRGPQVGIQSLNDITKSQYQKVKVTIERKLQQENNQGTP